MSLPEESISQPLPLLVLRFVYWGMVPSEIEKSGDWGLDGGQNGGEIRSFAFSFLVVT